MSSTSHSRRKVYPVDDHRHRELSSHRRLVQERKKAEQYQGRYDRLRERFYRHESYYSSLSKLLCVLRGHQGYC